MKKTIGILGGMGPLATADLFRKITLFTKAGCDNGQKKPIIFFMKEHRSVRILAIPIFITVPQ